MHNNIISILILIFIFTIGSNLEKYGFFFRDNIYEVKLNIKGDIVSASNLKVYCFIGKKYKHSNFSSVPFHARTNISYLYGIKLNDSKNDYVFQHEGTSFNLNQTIKRSIYVHPDCNTHISFFSGIKDCDGPPSFVALFATGLTKKLKYGVENLSINVFINLKKSSNVNKKMMNKTETFDDIKLNIFNISINYSEFYSMIDVLNIFKIKSNEVIHDSISIRDPINYILMKNI